jgi:hypothetical protein
MLARRTGRIQANVGVVTRGFVVLGSGKSPPAKNDGFGLIVLT